MKKMTSHIISFWKRQQKYFEEFEEEIAIRNLELMRTACCAGIVIFLLYYIGIKIFFDAWSTSVLYVFPEIIIFAVFFLVINRKIKKRPFEVKGVFPLVLLMYVFLLAVMMILSVFPNPDIPSIYYHMFVIASPVVFILPFYFHVAILVLSYAVFSFMVIQFKAPDVWSHELFESFTAIIFACVVLILMSQFRLQSESLKSKYFEMSQLDGLTNLLNKVSGIQISEQYLSELKKEEHFAVLFMDLDNFKRINDSYGHIKGDELLRAVSGVLNVNCRSKDIICRFGGDEFLIVLKNIPNQTIAMQRVEAIKEQIHAINIKPIHDISCSIGVYYIESLEEMNMKTILNKVDEALYAAKQKGKNCYHVVK